MCVCVCVCFWSSCLVIGMILRALLMKHPYLSVIIRIRLSLSIITGITTAILNPKP